MPTLCYSELLLEPHSHPLETSLKMSAQLAQLEEEKQQYQEQVIGLAFAPYPALHLHLVCISLTSF